MYELIYTSTPQGLITGRSGFTTVALTEGFPPNLIAPVENLSGYKALFAPGDVNENFNPVNYCCQHFQLGRTPYIVLSRIAFAGLSYTGRSNVLAHHLLFQPGELDDIPGGTVSVLRAQENFPPWSGNPRMLPPKRRAAAMPPAQGGCAWERLAGDRRWAQYTAEHFRANPDKTLALAFDPLQVQGSDILELIAETAACLTSDELRRLAFSTYSYSSGVSNPFFFRAYVNDSPQLGSIRRLDPGSVITLGASNPLPAGWSEKKNTPQVVTLYAEEERCVPREQLFQQPEERPEPLAEQLQGVTFNLPAQNTPPAPQVPPAVRAEFPQPPREDEEEEKAGIGKKIIAFLLLCVVAGLLVLVAVRIFFAGGDNKKATPLPDDLVQEAINGSSQPAPAVKKTTPAPAVKKNTPAPAGKAVSAPVKKAPRAEKKPRPQPVSVRTPAVEKKKTAPLAFGQLSAAQEFELYRSFFKGMTFRLPEALRESSALELQLHSVGGLADVRDLKGFVSGNGTKTVSICSRREQNTGLMVEWEPDHAPAGKLTFGLSQRGMLTIRKAQKAGDTAPRLQDVTRLTFVSPKNDRYDLLPGRVPRSIFSILNARKKLTACFSDMRISCVLKFSEDLWLFRSFCTVRVNGRNLGYDVMAEGMKDIPVHEMDLMHIRGMIRKRNDALLKLQEERKQLNALTRQFDTLLAAGTASQNKLNRLLPGRRKELRQLSAALLKDDKDTAEKIMDELSHDLLRKVKEEKIKAKDKNDFEAELEEFRKISGDSAAADAQRKKCQERLKKAEQDFSRHDGNLRNDLKNLSPALYRLGCKVMTVGAEHKVLPLEFYRQISEAELLKDIQVEIIRKERP